MGRRMEYNVENIKKRFSKGVRCIVSRVDFDDYSESYNRLMKEGVGFFEKEEGYFSRYKIEIVRRLTSEEPGRILEYGCGVGRNIGQIRALFPHSSIYGCDVSQKSIEAARKQNPDAEFFVIGEGRISMEFDLVLLVNVLHHVLPQERKRLVDILAALLSDGGSLFVFEHNPFNPVTRRVVNTCPFDKDAVLLRPKEVSVLISGSGLETGERGYCLFFPGFLRGLRRLEKCLFWLPLGGQYFFKARKTGP
jgi:SAM-dependent methyltransferase